MSTRRSRAARDRLWNRGALFVFALTGGVLLFYLAVFFSPELVEGLLPSTKPAATTVQVVALPSSTPTGAATKTTPPTWTPTATLTPQPSDAPTDTPTSTSTRGPTPTFPPTWTPVPPPGTPVPTRSNYPFALQNNEVIFTQYFFSSGCDWLGIAGLVLDREGNPVTGMPVVINGGGFQNRVTYSGDAPAYGESGWEHFLDNKVKEGDFAIQLYDNHGQPASDQIHVRTRADCRSNLIMIIFELNWEEYIP